MATYTVNYFAPGGSTAQPTMTIQADKVSISDGFLVFANTATSSVVAMIPVSAQPVVTSTPA